MYRKKQFVNVPILEMKDDVGMRKCRKKRKRTIQNGEPVIQYSSLTNTECRPLFY